MKRLQAKIGCFALLAIIMTPISSDAQMGVPSVGSYSESPGMGIDKGDTWRELMEASENIPLDEDAYTTITRSRTYHLSSLDNRSTGKAIAWEQTKESIIDELIDNITKEARATISVSKKVYGKSSGISYELLPDHENIKMILPSIISFEQTMEDWGDGILKLKAKTRVALSRIVPAISAIRAKPAAYGEISGVRNMATEAMKKIIQMQNALAESSSKTTSNQPYIDAVNRLITADQLEKGRYLALKGETQQAIKAYTMAIETSPALAIAYRNRGGIHLHLKNHDKAMEDFLKAHASDAIDHTQARDFQACLADTEAALKLFEDYATAYYQRAVCNIGLGQQKTVKDDFIKAAQLGEKRAQDFLSSKGITW